MRHRATAEEWIDIRRAVIRRDGGCIAIWRSVVGDAAAVDFCSGPIELDHVQSLATMGAKAPDMVEHLVQLCHHHHQGGWATANRDAERDYLRRLYPEHWASEPCGER